MLDDLKLIHSKDSNDTLGTASKQYQQVLQTHFGAKQSATASSHKKSENCNKLSYFMFCLSSTCVQVQI